MNSLSDDGVQVTGGPFVFRLNKFDPLREVEVVLPQVLVCAEVANGLAEADCPTFGREVMNAGQLIGCHSRVLQVLGRLDDLLAWMSHEIPPSDDAGSAEASFSDA